VTLLGRWPRPKHSSDRVMIENALRCCLHISSGSCGSAACDCAGRAVPSLSSRWQRSRRTSAGWPSSSPGRHRCPPQVWREPQSRCSCVEASAQSLQSHRCQTERVAAAKASARRPGELPLSSATFAIKSATSGLVQCSKHRARVCCGWRPHELWNESSQHLSSSRGLRGARPKRSKAG
jgi:hypothetical protein